MPFRYLCPGCHRLGDTPGRCAECKRQYERGRRRRRGKTAARGYDARWRQLVELAIRAHPYCVDCRHPGSADNPLTGDHIIPRADGGPNTLDNIAVRCRVCNGRRGATVRRRKSRLLLEARAVTPSPGEWEKNCARNLFRGKLGEGSAIALLKKPGGRQKRAHLNAPGERLALSLRIRGAPAREGSLQLSSGGPRSRRASADPVTRTRDVAPAKRARRGVPRDEASRHLARGLV
jgi:5-methylcytosine-specific restriction enzyme A